MERDGACYEPTPLRRSISIGDFYSFHYYEFSSSFRGCAESHDFWELVYVDSGRISCVAGERSILLKMGQAVFHPPRETHNIVSLGVSAAVCILSFACGELGPDLFAERVVTFTEGERRLMGEIFRTGSALFEPPYNLLRQWKLRLLPGAPPGLEQIFRNLAENLVVQIVSRQPALPGGEAAAAKGASHRGRNSEKEAVACIVAFMKENLNRKLTVREICAYSAFSPSHLHALFKKQAGSSVMLFFNRLKIDSAKEMIAAGKHSFTQISASLGYNSVHYFSHAFRRQVGMSPSEYSESVKMTALL